MTERMQDVAVKCQSVGTPEVGDGLKTVLLAPDGMVESANGQFLVDAEGAAMMVASFDRQGVELVIDFEHQTLGGAYSAPDGRAPAAGWVTKIWYAVGRGVSALVRWNAKTREAIREGAYGYLSPVMIVRKNDLKAIGLHSVGLTNKPAIMGLQRVAASTRLTDTEGKPMADGTVEVSVSPVIAEIAGLLNMPVKADTTATAVLTACRDKLKALVADAPGATVKAVCKALGVAEGVSETEIVARIAALKSDPGAIAKQGEELRALKQRVAERDADDLMTVHGKGKLNPNAKEAWAAFKDMAVKEPDRFVKVMSEMPVTCPEGRTTPPTARQRVIALSESDYRSNVGHQKATSLVAFVSNALREKGLGKLTEGETSELSVG